MQDLGTFMSQKLKLLQKKWLP